MTPLSDALRQEAERITLEIELDICGHMICDAPDKPTQPHHLPQDVTPRVVAEILALCEKVRAEAHDAGLEDVIQVLERKFFYGISFEAVKAAIRAEQEKGKR